MMTSFVVKMTVIGEVRRTVVEAFHEISVHGFIFLVKRGTNFIEKLIWLACIVVGVFGMVYLG